MNPVSIMARFAPENHGEESAIYGFKIVIPPLHHRRFKAAMFQIAELHLRRRTYGAGGGLLLTGLSGAGKSTIVRSYCGEFPRQHQADRTHIPVLLVSVPPSPTARSLAGAILEAMGRKKVYRATAPEKTSMIYELFAKCGVEMVILDEFHHLFYTPTVTAFRDVTDWLKNFLEDTKVGLVGCGLPTAEHVVNSNEQLARRFSERIRISPFSLENEEDFHEFRGILKAFGSALPLSAETPLHEANLARRFHVASYGLLDYVVKILEGSVSAATMAGVEQLGLETFAAGFRNRVWRDVPDRLNPFHFESSLRAMDRSGEVFYLHTRQDPVGSPVARKLGMNFSRGSGSHG